MTEALLILGRAMMIIIGIITFIATILNILKYREYVESNKDNSIDGDPKISELRNRILISIPFFLGLLFMYFVLFPMLAGH